MEKRTYTCDVCGTDKKETNHWFAVFVMARVSPPPRIYVVSLQDLAGCREEEAAKHVCGEQCVTKMISQSLSALLPAPMAGASEGAPN